VPSDLQLETDQPGTAAAHQSAARMSRTSAGPNTPLQPNDGKADDVGPPERNEADISADGEGYVSVDSDSDDPISDYHNQGIEYEDYRQYVLSSSVKQPVARSLSPAAPSSQYGAFKAGLWVALLSALALIGTLLFLFVQHKRIKGRAPLSNQITV
jgi:hypothetical protein